MFILCIHAQVHVYVCIFCIYVYICTHTHTHMLFFFSQLSYLDTGSLELELPEEIIITLHVASPTGTVLHNEQELKVDLDNDCLFPFLE